MPRTVGRQTDVSEKVAVWQRNDAWWRIVLAPVAQPFERLCKRLPRR